MSKIRTVTRKGIHVNYGGYEITAPLPFEIPTNAQALQWDATTLTLSWVVSGSDPEGEPTQESQVLTQQQLDEARNYTAPPPPVDIGDLREKLWNSYHTHALDQLDENSRLTVLGLLGKSDATAQQQQRAADVMGWWESHWLDYGAKRTELLANETMPEYTFTDAPWTIWEVTA